MTVSMDAWGGPWWEEPEPLEELLPRGDVILANESEALAMTGAPDVERAMATMAEGASSGPLMMMVQPAPSAETILRIAWL